MLSHVTLTVPSELLWEVLKGLLSHNNFEEMMKKQQMIVDVSNSVSTKNGELVRRYSQFHHARHDGNTKNLHLFDQQLSEQKPREVQDFETRDY